MNRVCGKCTLCCKLVPVRELNKRAGERCKHQSSSKGCGVYHRLDRGFPPSCGMWSCRWLIDDEAAKLGRPDRVHYVIDHLFDMIGIRNPDTGEEQQISTLQIWVDPAWPDAWRDPALLAYADVHNIPMMIRYDNRRGFVAFPPSVTGDKGWQVSDKSQTEVVETVTGNRLLDTLVAGNVLPTLA